MAMTRVTAVSTPGDYPGTPDETTRTELAELFKTLFPNAENPAFDAAHTGMAIAALSPRLALNLAKMSGFMAKDLPWAQAHRQMNELAIQTLNIHFKSDYTLQSRQPAAAAAGLTPEMLAAVPQWRASDLFTEAQRLVIEYTQAVILGDVPPALFAKVVAQYGERGAVEFTAAIGWWSMWTMILNATYP
jgi:alkylhydroperoxidase family enzyme